METIKEMNGVRVLRRDDGKYGIECEGKIRWNYRTEYLATKTAQEISDENDKLDKYEQDHRG